MKHWLYAAAQAILEGGGKRDALGPMDENLRDDEDEEAGGREGDAAAGDQDDGGLSEALATQATIK